MRPVGPVLILIALITPIPWFIELSARYPDAAIFSQYLGAVALITMGFGQFLSTRLPGLESIFGGQDRIYVLHKWLAVGGLVALGLHDVVDAEIERLGQETLIADIAEDVGEIGYNGLLILGLATVTTFIPYRLWRWSHKFIGAFYGLGVFHFVFILKPFTLTDPVGVYILAFCIAGVGSYFYMLMLYAFVPGPSPYTVTEVTAKFGMTEVLLEPSGRGIRHVAGQFAFIGFQAPDLEEMHPYTISHAPTDGRQLRFSIKALGAYTERLGNTLTVGTGAHVNGAFGRFRRPRKSKAEIWIGAGIGITPFLAWAGQLEPDDEKPVHLFFCLRDLDNAPYVNELSEIARIVPGFSVHFIDSVTDQRITGQKVQEVSGLELRTSHVSFCGPEPLRELLRAQLIEAGLSRWRFQFEEFEIRSGIGVLKFVEWVLITAKFKPISS
jgi:predicted ferric reductase